MKERADRLDLLLAANHELPDEACSPLCDAGADVCDDNRDLRAEVEALRADNEALRAEVERLCAGSNPLSPYQAFVDGYREERAGRIRAEAARDRLRALEERLCSDFRWMRDDRNIERAACDLAEAERDSARADRDRLLTESAELRQALVRAVAREAELVALLDPDNDEAVQIVRRAFRPPWSDRCNDASAWRVLTFLRDAANGEGDGRG